MKTKILSVAILFFSLASCMRAQQPISPGGPGQVWTSNGGLYYPTWQNGGVILLDTTTVNLNSTGYQGYRLTGLSGDNYIVTDIVVTNASATPTSAKGGQWWTKKAHSGYNVAHTLKQTTSVFTYLITDSAFIDKSIGMITLYPGGEPFKLIRDSIYFNADTANGSSCQALMLTYGIKVQ
jgi:hypothetical protein